MKLLCLLFSSAILLLTITQRGTAQTASAKDTIYVSHRAKSYLLFDEPVTLADVGNPTLYQVQIEGNSVLMVATKDSVVSSPFYAVVGGEPFTAQLAFRTKPNAFYDFRKHRDRNGSSHHKPPSEGQVLEKLQQLASYRI